jgi:cellulose synthase operon protein C
VSLLATTQIPKPSDEQAFERASMVLWRGLLKDPNVQRNGRRGQRQNGVDLFGVRNGDASHHVGIQCKLKGPGQLLTEDEVRGEIKKALTFKPKLREYFIITTVPDDVALQELARESAADLREKGRTLLVYIWGWNTLEERISEDAAARKQFDPDYGAFSEQILDQVTRVAVGQEEIKAGIDIGLSQIDARLARFEALKTQPGDATTTTNVLEAQFHADIDTFRDLANAGMPKTALPLLEGLLARVKDTASGRVLFRIKANIGLCLLALGEDERTAELLSEAYDHAPSEPKAIANKAFSLLLQRRWQELLSFGTDALRADPNNEALAGYFVQAARFDASIPDPLDLLPDAVKNSAAVRIARVDFLRCRGSIPAWWHAARDTVAVYPGDPHAAQFAAEADLDEILSSDEFQRTRLFRPGDRTRIQAAVEILAAQWSKAHSREGVLRPEHAALCANLIVALHALDENPRAIEVARKGLESLPDNMEILSRAVAVAIDGHDEDFARQNLSRLPPSPAATVLAFRFHAQHHDWATVAALYKSQAAHIPDVERSLIDTAGRLAEIKLAAGKDAEVRIRALAEEVGNDPRASVVVADFATMEGLEAVAQEAYEAALKGVHADTHIASRVMVAMQAANRSDWNTLVDLLDGHIAEDHDSVELRSLARAFVNNTPIQKRAIRFFERLPPTIQNLPLYIHAAGLLHFNRGALKQAEETLRRAIAVEPDITNYLALFTTLRRSERRHEIGPILETLDAAVLDGTPGQKMCLAQEMFAAGQARKAVCFAYEVLQSAKNDPEAALRYFGLLMLDPSGGLIPTLDAVGVDAWIRLQGPHGESHSFLVAEGADRPAEGVLSPTHTIAAAAFGLKVGETFELKNGIGDDFEWRVAEIKHKYLHALHDVMENFQTRFPDAKGLYRLAIRDGDIQPALAQVRKLSESNRRLADLYLVQHFPMTMVASQFGGDPIGFAEYIRSLDRNIETCVGAEPERVTARETIVRHRAAGAVLDTYTVWTAATMDVLGVLVAVMLLCRSRAGCGRSGWSWPGAEIPKDLTSDIAFEAAYDFGF